MAAGAPHSPTAVGRRNEDPVRLLPWLRERSQFFARVDEALALQLFAMASLRTEARGKVLQKQEDRPQHVYIVVEGTLVIQVVRNKVVRELASYGPGDMANLLALIDQQPSPYEVVAVTNAQFIAIDAQKIAMYSACFHPVAMNLLQALTPVLVGHLRDLDVRASRLVQRRSASVTGSGQTFRRDDR
ncbi:MAG: cyclic nucleotide-binding domain-containing protein [Myxococcales bacterium]|nr:cyclic nucleotide-binding domain-containing protein [Myxococcales bacterium]